MASGTVSRDDLRRIIQHYLHCVEEEELRSLRVKLAGAGRSFLTPWIRSEPLFNPAETRVLLPADRITSTFLERGGSQAGERGRLFYGYPLWLDRDDFLSPLCTVEVEVAPVREGYSLAIVDPSAIMLNRYVLGLHALPAEEQEAIEVAFRQAGGSFAARIAAVFDYLGQEAPSFPAEALDALPRQGSRSARWANCPILFRSEGSAFTAQLRLELSAFLRYDRILEDAPRTALWVLTGNGGPRGARVAELLELLPLNQEQAAAGEAGLVEPLTVVTGPPGTGKSQVVIDLLASCALAGQRVLFASRNNKAVDVVRDRLQEILGKDHDFILRLGNRNKTEETRLEMISRLDAMPPSGGAPSRPDFADIDRRVLESHDERQHLLKTQADLRSATERLKAHAATVPEHWMTIAPRPAPPEEGFAHLRRHRGKAAVLAGEGEAGIGIRLLRWIAPQWLRRRQLRVLDEVRSSLPAVVADEVRATAEATPTFKAVVEAWDSMLGYLEWLTAAALVDKAEGLLLLCPPTGRAAQQLREAKAEKAQLSAGWLRDYWTHRVASARAIVRERLAQYFNATESLYNTSGGQAFAIQLDRLAKAIGSLGEYLPVWIVTSLSTRRNVPLKPALFDLVIIDEASQCDLASALPLLYRAKRAVVIGDDHQFKHISAIDREEEERIAQRVQLPPALLEDWSYVDRSLYDLAAAVGRRMRRPPILLTEHFRSHPLIAEFSNRTVYGNQLRLRTDLAGLERRTGSASLGVTWHQVDGRVPQGTKSVCNPDEVRAVMSLLDEWWQSGFLRRDGVRFGVVTPFRLQVQRLDEAIRSRSWWEHVKDRLTVGTAHQFQGDEGDVMIFSPVVAPGLYDRTRDWLTHTEHLLNVATTRARGMLHVVGDLSSCRGAGGFLEKFADYVSDMNPGNPETRMRGNPAQLAMAGLLREAGLWHHPEYVIDRYRFDFLAISPFGMRYDIEVDGRGHLKEEQLQRDAVRDEHVTRADYQVVRFTAEEVFNAPDRIRERLLRLP